MSAGRESVVTAVLAVTLLTYSENIKLFGVELAPKSCRAVHERRITRRNETNKESCTATSGSSSVQISLYSGAVQMLKRLSNSCSLQ